MSDDTKAFDELTKDLELARLRSLMGVAKLIAAKGLAGDPDFVTDLAAFLAVCASEHDGYMAAALNEENNG